MCKEKCWPLIVASLLVLLAGASACDEEAKGGSPGSSSTAVAPTAPPAPDDVASATGAPFPAEDRAGGAGPATDGSLATYSATLTALLDDAQLQIGDIYLALFAAMGGDESIDAQIDGAYATSDGFQHLLAGLREGLTETSAPAAVAAQHEELLAVIDDASAAWVTLSEQIGNARTQQEIYAQYDAVRVHLHEFVSVCEAIGETATANGVAFAGDCNINFE
jgi:hypothetical protein